MIRTFSKVAQRAHTVTGMWTLAPSVPSLSTNFSIHLDICEQQNAIVIIAVLIINPVTGLLDGFQER